MLENLKKNWRNQRKDRTKYWKYASWLNKKAIGLNCFLLENMNNLLSALLCEVLMIWSNFCFVIDEVHLFKSPTELGLINRKVDYLLCLGCLHSKSSFYPKDYLLGRIQRGLIWRDSFFYFLTKTYLIAAVLWILALSIRITYGWTSFISNFDLTWTSDLINSRMLLLLIVPSFVFIK